MKMRLSKLFLFPLSTVFLFVLALTVFTPCGMAADIVVVASAKVPDSSLSGDQLRAIFLGQQTSWPSGAKIEFVVLKDSSEVHESFLKKYVGRSAAQFSNYWKQQVFTGKGRMPRQFDTESNLLEYVSSRDGAIGYVSAGAGKGAAKSISIK